MFYRLRRSNREPGYWFQIIADDGQILAESGVYATRAAVDRTIATICHEAGGATIVDQTLD